jgi:hypothetical protein
LSHITQRIGLLLEFAQDGGFGEEDFSALFPPKNGD